MIATYALCGFANLGAMGVMVGTVGMYEYKAHVIVSQSNIYYLHVPIDTSQLLEFTESCEYTYIHTYMHKNSTGIFYVGAIAPSRKSETAKMIFTAMWAGNFACFLTACVAGLLYDPQQNR